MNHLSEQELYDYADGRSGAPDAAVSQHLAECGTCRSVAALQRQIRTSAAGADEGLLSNNFTKRIMLDIRVPLAAPRFSWLADNSAHLVAMIFVVGVVGCIMYSAAQSSPVADDSAYARLFAFWHDGYRYAMSAFMPRNTEALLPVVSETTGLFNGVFFMGIAALLVLGSLDKLRVFSRIFKAR